MPKKRSSLSNAQAAVLTAMILDDAMLVVSSSFTFGERARLDNPDGSFLRRAHMATAHSLTAMYTRYINSPIRSGISWSYLTAHHTKGNINSREYFYKVSLEGRAALEKYRANLAKG